MTTAHPITCPSCALEIPASAEVGVSPDKCPRCGAQLLAPPSSGAASPASGSGTAKSSWRIRAGSPTGGALRRIARFEVTGALGKGAFGEVWRAYDPNLDREVALKVPRFEDASGKEAERFFREARAAAQLHHPNIVAIHDAGDSEGQFYIASELIEGVPLSVWLKENTPTFEQTAEIIRKLAEALHYAHTQGIFHRDIKPANVMIDAAGEPHLMDFGLARRPDQEATMTMDGALVGTPSYMSPEQAGGKGRQADARSDLYSLGVVLYEMLVGRKPFDGPPPVVMHKILNEEPEPPRKIDAKIPRDLETICLKCLAKEPERRYPSAQHLAEELHRWLRGEPIQARPIKTHERLWLWCRRNPRLATASGLALAGLLGTAVISLVSAAHLQQEQSNTLAALVEAKEKGELAREKALLAENRLQETLREAASSALLQGVALAAKDDFSQGLVWMARGLELATQAQAADLEHLIRMNITAWYRPPPPVLPILRHRDEVSALAFSPDGQRLLTGSLDNTAQVWEVATGTPVGPVMQHPGPNLWDVAFSLDGKHAITGSGGAIVRFWEIATGTILTTANTDSGVYCVTVSSDGKFAMAGTSKGSIYKWELPTGKLVGPPQKTVAAYLGMAISADGNKSASASFTGEIKITDLSSGKVIGKPLDHQGQVWKLAFSPDGTKLLSGSKDGTARLWEVSTGKPLLPPLRQQGPILSVAYSRDGRWLATGALNGLAQVWDAASGEPLGPPLRNQGEIVALAFSPDQKLLAVGTGDWGRMGEVRLWPFPKPHTPGLTMAHGAEVVSVLFSPDSKTIVTGTYRGSSSSGTARLWHAETAKQFPVSFLHGNSITTALFSPDSKSVLTTGDDGKARLWDVGTGKVLFPPMEHGSTIWTGEFSRDGKTVGTASKDGTVRLWEVATGKPSGVLKHQASVIDVDFSPDEKAVLTGSEDRTACLWDRVTGNRMHSLEHPAAVLDVAFSPDGSTVLTACFDGIARFWDVGTGQPVGLPMQHQGPVSLAQFSPDGKTVLTGSYDGTARLWDADTGKPLGRALNHQNSIRCATFSADSRLILTGSFDSTARLWDVATGKPIGPPMQHQSSVYGVALSRDGKRAATASYDMTAKLWPVPAPVTGEVERIVLWAQVRSGMEMSEDGAPRILEESAVRQRKQKLQELGGPPLP